MKKLVLKISTLFTLLLASPVHAQLENVAPQRTGAQKEFAKLIASGQFAEALMAWNSAFGKSSFGKSDTGVALHGYLLAKSGFPLLASQWITRDTNLKKISKQLRPDVTKLIGSQASYLSTKGAHKSWTGWIEDHSPIAIKNSKDLNWIAHRLKKTAKSNSDQRARFLWSLSVGAAKLNKAKLAEKYIRELKGLGQEVVGEDKIEIQLARVLFQRNKLNEAIDSYSLIPKTSEFWLDAIEERAWAHLRLGNYDSARADITTLLAPTFKDYASAEVYVLAAITNLKICDYPQILEDGKKFKERHVTRIREMESLAEKGVNTHISAILTRMDQTGADLAAAAGKLSSLPRMALRSQDFTQAVNTRARLLKEAGEAKALIQRLSVMGGNASLDQLVEWAHREAQQLRTASLRAIKSLAKEEVKEYRVMINKMKLAEVEVIHRFNVDDTLRLKRGKLEKMSHGKDTLVFPYTEEIWVDELDNYQARVKDCPTANKASL